MFMSYGEVSGLYAFIQPEVELSKNLTYQDLTKNSRNNNISIIIQGYRETKIFRQRTYTNYLLCAII